MKFFACAFFILAIIACAWAADSCKLDGKTLKAGETHQPSGKCQVYKCQKDGTLTATTCPSIAAPPTCKYTPQDDSKPYPSCCEKYDC